MPTSPLAAPSPRQLVEVVDLSGPAISPDGAWVAFRQEQASIARNTYDSAWFVAPVDGHTPAHRIADGGTPIRPDAGVVVAEPPTWSPDGRWIYFRAALGDQVQVWRAAADGSQARPITTDAADVDSFVLSRDGLRLFYRIGADRAAIDQAERAEYDNGVRIDAATPVGQPLFRSGQVNGRAATVRMAGNWAARAGLLATAPKRWRLVELPTMVARDATLAEAIAIDQTPAARAQALEAGWTRAAIAPVTGERAIVFADHGASSLKVTRPAETTIVCPAAACRGATIAAVAWRPGHDQVLVTTLDHARGKAESLGLWDVRTGAVRTLLQSPGLINGGRGFGPNESCAVAAEAAVCVEASANRPPRLVRVSLANGEETPLFSPNQALADAAGPPVRLLTWSDDHGESFTGQYFPAAPAQTGRSPLFISYYSCTGYPRGAVGDEWPLASLAGAGIAALCINEPAADARSPDQLVRYRAALSGVSAIVHKLGCDGLTDPARVGMGGLSFGSEVTLWTAMNSDLLAAASVTSPAVTSTYFLFHRLQGAEFTDSLKSRWGLGDPRETPERWALLSPARNVDRIHAPLLMQMPEQEYLEAMDYFVPLAQSSTPTELYAFPDEPHQKVQPRHKLAAYERNLDWFRFWLQDYADPDPLKADQYRRWQALRARAAKTGAKPAGASNAVLSCAHTPARP